MRIRPLDPGDLPELLAFFGRVPEGDRTFFKLDVLDPEAVSRWALGGRGIRVVAGDPGGTVAGCAALIPGVDWSSHVGELQVVVDPAHRRRGVGRGLARRGLLEGLGLGLRKIVVEVVADQAAALSMFQALGFAPEALLRDHVRDRTGRLADLVVLAHHVEERWGDISTLGIADAVG